MDSRVAVIGAGSLGCTLVAWLVEAGVEVVLCARNKIPGIAVELRADGRTLTPEVPVAYDPAEVDPVDIVFVTTKAQDTDQAAGWLWALVAPETVVVLVQNGIDHARRVDGLVPPGQVLPSIAYISAERTRPGHVVHQFGTRLVTPAGALSNRLRDAVRASVLTVEGVPDFLTASWQKLLGNLANNPITALTTGRMAVYAVPDVRELARAILEEGVAVGRAEGADLGPASIQAVFDMVDGLSPDNGTSMLYDRLAGRPLEHEHLTGAVVTAADRHGIPVPVNRTVLALLRGLDASLRPHAGGAKNSSAMPSGSLRETPEP